MERSTKFGRWIVALGIGWPIYCLGVMVFSPGPVDTPALPHARRLARPSFAPPTDTSGSTQYVSTGGSTQGVKIFWDEPEAGRVHVTIEVPGTNEPEG